MTIFAAMLLAGYWVFLVPFLQSPDEDSHADYVFCLYSRGGLIQGSGAPIFSFQHPYIKYLQSATNANLVGFRPYVKMPSDYGTQAFFARIDKNAPRGTPHWQTYPFRLAIYPCGYYALTALWLGLVSHLHTSLSFLFFSARIFSVLLLGSGLALSYLTMRELGLSGRQSSLVLATIGFFPLVSFVGSYIQPDNLTFVSVSACFYLALRWRNEFIKSDHHSELPLRGKKTSWLLGLALAILFLSKYHFFCCVGLAIAFMITATSFYTRVCPKEMVTNLGKLLIPSLVACALQFWISGFASIADVGCGGTDKEWLRVLRIGGEPLISHIKSALCDQVQSVYWLDGRTFRSFWGEFGWLDTPLIIISQRADDFLRTIINTLTLIVLSLSLASLVKITLTALRLLKTRHRRSAFYLACSNPLMSSYFFFMLVIFPLNIIFYPTYTGQGRHWFPLILPIVLEAACFAPRIFARKTIRQLVFWFVVTAWLSYSLLGSYYAISCVHKRYYELDQKPFIDFSKLKATNILTDGSIQHCDFLDQSYYHSNTLIMPKGVNIDIWGWAIDKIAHTTALTVLLYIDNNKIYQTTYGLPDRQPKEELHDRKYRLDGYAAIIPTKDLSLGWHSLTMKVVSKDGHFLYNTRAYIRFVLKEH